MEKLIKILTILVFDFVLLVITAVLILFIAWMLLGIYIDFEKFMTIF